MYWVFCFDVFALSLLSSFSYFGAQSADQIEEATVVYAARIANDANHHLFIS